MKGKPPRLLIPMLAAMLGVSGLLAEETRSAEERRSGEETRRPREVRPTYSRDRVERTEIPAPEPVALPESLRIAVPREEPSAHESRDRDDGAARTRPPKTEPASPDDLESRARQAAVWAAAEAIERYGRPRYFEIGFHAGLHDAFRRAERDRWELEQGRSAGRFDPEARRIGEEIAYEEARLISADEAYRTVVQQFADLSREPERLAAPPPPPFGAAAFTVPEPDLHDVFRELPWRGQRAAGFRDLRLDPWRLYRAGRHDDFYRTDWRTPRFGLDLWRKRHGSSRWTRALSPDERRRFEGAFESAFEAELARDFAAVADRYFDRGYDAGWRHGIRVGREWQYRRGYQQGFEGAVQNAARGAFAAAFRPAWLEAYDPLFHEWSTTMKLETRAARLRDGNDDGVFEPGEELIAELDLVNLGGGSGRLDATLTGAALSDSDRLSLLVPRRSPVHPPRPLRGRISAAARPTADTAVTVAIGALSETLPVSVSYVLRFDGGLVLAGHDALRGTATVELRLVNASRRAADAVVDADLRGGALRRPRHELGQIPAGAAREVRFEVYDVRPLDLIAGDLVLAAVSETDGRAQERLDGRLPDLSTDLSDRSLVDFLLWLARSPSMDRSEVSRAHELMLRRLAVDWTAVGRADGNPYRNDLRTGGGSTALGELVAAVRTVRRTAADRSVFTDLVPRIEALSRSLPGNHPFLRRAMRKLARQLL
jgi:hypothetical protein